MESREKKLETFVLSLERRTLALLETAKLGIARPAELARKLSRSTQNMNIALRELESQKLVECINPENRIWKRYKITEHGRRFAKKIEKLKI